MIAQRDGIAAKLIGVAALTALAEVLVNGLCLGAVAGGFALDWLGALVLTRSAVLGTRRTRWAVGAAGAFALVLVDDPSLLAWTLFWTALSLAALLPRRGFDDAFGWAARLGFHALAAIVAPVTDHARLARLRQRRGSGRVGGRGVVGTLAPPVLGGALFLALFAGANPVIGDLLARVALPDAWTAIWRTVLAAAVALPVWASLRPSRRASAIGAPAWQGGNAPALPVATLALSLATFNAVFAVENALDVAFLCSGAALPAGVTMAAYAHRGAYSLIVAALLAGAFVLAALRPGSAGAASPAVRRLLALWIAQTLLLVASSALRTLDYVDTYGMTVLRLAALAWMALVAAGLLLIGWRLLAGKSARWLVNANAAAAALVLAVASVVDLGATAAAWNARVALARGAAAPPLDLCYMAGLGPSSLTSLAMLEEHVREPELRDRVAFLRWRVEVETAARQADWRRWTWRNARRLSAVRAEVGTAAPRLRAAPFGRGCDGAIIPPPPVIVTPAPPPVLTREPGR